MFAEYASLLGEPFKDFWYGEVQPLLSSMNCDSPFFWLGACGVIFIGWLVYQRL